MGIGRDLAEKFWLDVQTLGDEDRGLDLVIDTVDKMCRAENWDAIVTLMRAYDPRKYRPAMTITMISSVEPVRDHLPYYDEFRARVREALVENLGSERADEMLFGF